LIELVSMSVRSKWL